VEPRRRSVFPNPDRFAPPRQPPDAVGPLPLSSTWAHAHGAVPAVARAVSSLMGRLGRFARGAARPRCAEITPLGPFSREILFFFYFYFPFSHLYIYIYIYIHMLIFYAPKIVQTLSKTHNMIMLRI
jgi:hypothetical protein